MNRLSVFLAVFTLGWLFSASPLAAGEPAAVFSLRNYREVAYAGLPVFFENRLYLVDRPLQAVRVYGIEKGLESPSFLWETPGNGRGPGEIPDSYNNAVNQISVVPESGELWISHSQGLLVFDRSGELTREVRRPFNEARILHLNGDILFTAKNVLSDRRVITRVSRDLKTVRWSVDWPHEVPVTPQGYFLKPMPELWRFEELIYMFDPSCGSLLAVDQKGVERFFVRFPLTRVEVFSLSHYAPFQPGRAFGLSSGPDPRSGMLRYPENGDRLWVVVPHRAKKIRLARGETLELELEEVTEWRLFLCFNRKTGAALGRYLHPELFRKNLNLVRLWRGKFLLFDKDEGDTFFLIDPAELQRLAD